MKKLVFIPLYCILHFNAIAQARLDSTYIDVLAINDSISVSEQADFFLDSDKNVLLSNIPLQQFVPLTSFAKRKKLPIHLITKTSYLRFNLFNSGTNYDTVYVYPGFLFQTVDLYRQTSSGNLEALPKLGAYSGYPGFILAPNEKIQLYAKLLPSKTDFISINPQLISKNYLPSYMKLRFHMNDNLRTVGFILSGILLMMILFTAANYFLNRKKDFLYYSLYSTCMFSLIFLYALLHIQPSWFNAIFRGYFDFFLILVGTIFYIAFTRNFLNTKTNYPFLNKLFRAEEFFLLGLLFLYSFIHFFTTAFWLENILENSMKFIALAIGVVYVVVAVAQKKRLLNYLAIGNAALIIFSSVSLALIWLNVRGTTVYTSSLFYYDIGLVIALIFYLIGLTYKNREDLIERTKREESMKQHAEIKEYENQLAVLKAQQEERNRISADMHDDLGAGMTSIRLYSELAKNKVKDIDLPEIDKISSSANELLNKMNAIIWSMSSSNDSLENMIAYIRTYALEYFENTGIECKIIIPPSLPFAEVNGTIRRNVFLVVKEALNNVLKHSGATNVDITLTINGKVLKLIIQDNGKGIDMENLRRFSNGLKNMKKRMEDVEIGFTIENHQGTRITLTREIRN